MERRTLMTLAALASGVSAVSPVWAQLNLGKMLEAGKDLSKSESLSDDQLKSYFDQMSADMDRRPAAPTLAGSPS
jgi:putative metalloprotease